MFIDLNCPSFCLCVFISEAAQLEVCFCIYADSSADSSSSLKLFFWQPERTALCFYECCLYYFVFSRFINSLFFHLFVVLVSLCSVYLCLDFLHCLFFDPVFFVFVFNAGYQVQLSVSICCFLFVYIVYMINLVYSV